MTITINRKQETSNAISSLYLVINNLLILAGRHEDLHTTETIVNDINKLYSVIKLLSKDPEVFTDEEFEKLGESLVDRMKMPLKGRLIWA